MKIEMGESLFYSWLRHVKECQIVQTNWKVSPQWDFRNTDEIGKMLNDLNTYFKQTYSLEVFKKNSSLSQIIQQGECDALGINKQNEGISYYAVDVAFHEDGLNYGKKFETVCKVIFKCIRTAFCLYGYFDAKCAEIVFASPKIFPNVLTPLLPLVEYLNAYFKSKGFSYNFRIICNEDFDTTVVKPILLVSKDVADTSELFMRAYQMLAMFEKAKPKTYNVKTPDTIELKDWTKEPVVLINYANEDDAYKELKVGQIARTVLSNILESGNVTDAEIAEMQTSEYSKKTFDIQYPLLVAEGTAHDKLRYYSKPVVIKGKVYYLCSQWFETSANNDRKYLLKWIKEHTI